LASISTKDALPLISDHVLPSCFNFDVSLSDLISFNPVNATTSENSLLNTVNSAFTKVFQRRIQSFADVLQNKFVRLPEEILFNLIPYLHGAVPNVVLVDIVDAVKDLLSKNKQQKANANM